MTISFCTIFFELALVATGVVLVMLGLDWMECRQAMEEAPIVNIIMVAKVCGVEYAREEFPIWVLTAISVGMFLLAASIPARMALGLFRLVQRIRAEQGVMYEMRTEHIDMMISTVSTPRRTQPERRVKNPRSSGKKF